MESHFCLPYFELSSVPLWLKSILTKHNLTWGSQVTPLGLDFLGWPLAVLRGPTRPMTCSLPLSSHSPPPPELPLSQGVSFLKLPSPCPASSEGGAPGERIHPRTSVCCVPVLGREATILHQRFPNCPKASWSLRETGHRQRPHFRSPTAAGARPSLTPRGEPNGM